MPFTWGQVLFSPFLPPCLSIFSLFPPLSDLVQNIERCIRHSQKNVCARVIFLNLQINE